MAVPRRPLQTRQRRLLLLVPPRLRHRPQRRLQHRLQHRLLRRAPRRVPAPSGLSVTSTTPSDAATNVDRTLALGFSLNDAPNSNSFTGANSSNISVTAPENLLVNVAATVSLDTVTPNANAWQTRREDQLHRAARPEHCRHLGTNARLELFVELHDPARGFYAGGNRNCPDQ